MMNMNMNTKTYNESPMMSTIEFANCEGLDLAQAHPETLDKLVESGEIVWLTMPHVSEGCVYGNQIYPYIIKNGLMSKYTLYPVLNEDVLAKYDMKYVKGGHVFTFVENMGCYFPADTDIHVSTNYAFINKLRHEIASKFN